MLLIDNGLSCTPAIKVMGNDIHGREVHEAKTKSNKASYADVHHKDVLHSRARFDVQPCY